MHSVSRWEARGSWRPWPDRLEQTRMELLWRTGSGLSADHRSLGSAKPLVVEAEEVGFEPAGPAFRAYPRHAALIAESGL
jgi:hypothetical protein